jgi:hypothetical protein
MNGFQLGQIGVQASGSAVAPGNSDVDSSLRKNFKIIERVKMQF